MSRNPKENEGHFSLSLIELIAIVKKNLLKIIIVSVLCGGICFVVDEYVLQPTFEATATMSVITKSEDTMNITNDQITSAENLVDTYAVVIQSKKVLQQVIDQLGLNVSYSTLKKLVSVKSVNGTQIMEITVKSNDPQVAKKILAQIVIVSPDEIINAIGAGAVRVIDEAECSNKKVEPHTFLNILVTMFLSAVVLLIIAIIRFLLNDTYRNDEELQDDLAIPVLGVVPLLEGSNVGTNKSISHVKKSRRGKGNGQ